VVNGILQGSPLGVELGKAGEFFLLAFQLLEPGINLLEVFADLLPLLL